MASATVQLALSFRVSTPADPASLARMPDPLVIAPSVSALKMPKRACPIVQAPVVSHLELPVTVTLPDELAFRPRTAREFENSPPRLNLILAVSVSPTTTVPPAVHFEPAPSIVTFADPAM